MGSIVGRGVGAVGVAVGGWVGTPRSAVGVSVGSTVGRGDGRGVGDTPEAWPAVV